MFFSNLIILYSTILSLDTIFFLKAWVLYCKKRTIHLIFYYLLPLSETCFFKPGINLTSLCYCDPHRTPPPPCWVPNIEMAPTSLEYKVCFQSLWNTCCFVLNIWHIWLLRYFCCVSLKAKLKKTTEIKAMRQNRKIPIGISCYYHSFKAVFG
jgi:hypothetical protein